MRVSRRAKLADTMSEDNTDEDEILVIEFPDFAEALGVMRDKGFPGTSNPDFPSSSSELKIEGLDTGAPTCKMAIFNSLGRSRSP